jgi:hypothetical protein
MEVLPYVYKKKTKEVDHVQHPFPATFSRLLPDYANHSDLADATETATDFLQNRNASRPAITVRQSQLFAILH